MENREPKIHTIYISVENGEVICTPALQHVSYKDDVEWVYEGETFTVHFGSNSPFKKKNFKAKKPGKNKILVNVTDTEHSLDFKYTVAVLDGDEILVSDPTIIVDP